MTGSGDAVAGRGLLDPRVKEVVLNTPGARELLASLTNYTTLRVGPRRITIGCAGGLTAQAA
ncbi:hypothetical protein [Streptomyces kanasensis]|uniref:hypothetical protein n=1 Tax=Streptomyces kanasensis TaxID=936756 RepID=UPI0012FFC093|nr:hypothetical protein [Streptomyces kanasensis]